MSGLIIFGLTLSLFFLIKAHLKARKALKKYQPLINLDAEIEQRTKATQTALIQQREAELALAKLSETVKILNDDYDVLSAGFYRSRYDFGDSASYEARLDEIRDKQKDLIKAKQAIICRSKWEVGGSKKEGQKMTDRIIKLGLSAFNVQCDNEILSVRFDNIDRSEAKISKVRENVDKLLEANHCQITDDFFKLKLDELYLTYEHAEQVHKEKEEQKALREQLREEEKARREAERAQTEAEREEKRYESALEKAKADLKEKSAEERETWVAKIAELEGQLRQAHENKERAKSMAELTKKGHVYIISNIGSFGEQVFKIGMTRRLDPMDRIWELGDASVPFDFDVHALVQSDDAPALEKKLHEMFEKFRVNRVNERKEFFKVRLEDIALACKKFHGQEFKLTLMAEAKEYRQSVALVSNAEKKAA